VWSRRKVGVKLGYGIVRDYRSMASIGMGVKIRVKYSIGVEG